MFQNCSNCGGRLEQSPDGRAVACGYCGSSSSVTVDPRALAAGIAGDSKTLHAGFERLLAVFQETLPSVTTVHESGLLFKKVTGFDVVLDELTFRLIRDHDTIVAHRIAVVRGITLKTETMHLEAWITALAERLSEMAGTAPQPARHSPVSRGERAITESTPRPKRNSGPEWGDTHMDSCFFVAGRGIVHAGSDH